MSADTTDNTPPGEVVAGGIRPLRKMRGSAPISAELFTSTANALVIAFQTSAMFAAADDPALTLAVLQQRWTASRRGAAEARRALIDLGYWVEVTARQPDGRFKIETRTWETRLTEDDLTDLAAEYTPSSVIECGGRAYVVTPDGLQTRDGEAPRRGSRPTLQNPRRTRHTASGNPARPAETLDASATDLPPVVTRSDQRVVDNSTTDLPPVVTRRAQQQQDEFAGHTDLPPAVGQHASITFGDGSTCMHDEFWAVIGRKVSTPIDSGGRRSVYTQLDVAFQAGWLPEVLARWVVDQVSAAKRLSNPPGFVIARLREIPAPAEVPPSMQELDNERAAERRRISEQRIAARRACEMCDEDGFIGSRRCDHDPESARVAQEGRAKAHKALEQISERRQARAAG